MIRRFAYLLTIGFLFVLTANPALAQSNAEEILDNAQKKLQPYSIQKNQKEDENDLITSICNIINISWICSGTKTHQVYAPNPKSFSEEELRQISVAGQSINESSENVEGTSSATVKEGEGDVLGLKDLLNSIANYTTGRILFTEEETAFTTRHTIAQAQMHEIENYKNQSDKAVLNVSQRVLIPLALHKNDGTFPTSTTVTPGTTPGVTGVPTGTVNITPGPTRSIGNGDASYHQANGYTIFYQNDPFYAQLQLPAGCTYIQAACGPFTVVNTLVNLGIWTTPEEVINNYYSNAGCDGTGLSQGKRILSRFGEFDYRYIFTGSWIPPSDKEMAQELKNYTDNGWIIWMHGSFWSERADRWIGHHFNVVEVTDDGTILTLDPYYGYLKPIPYDQFGLTGNFENALAIKHKTEY